MSTQAQIIADLAKIASTAQSVNYGTPQQATEIDEAVGFIRRLWKLANSVETLPTGPLLQVTNWLMGISDRCAQLSYFWDYDQEHLRTAVEYIHNLQAVASGSPVDE